MFVMAENEEMSMKELMDNIKESMIRIKSGDILKGKIISVTDKEAIVNIGYMADGIIPRDELMDNPDLSPKDVFKAGDEIYVYVEEVNDGEGNVLLSKIKAESLKVWEEFEDSLNNGTTFEVKVSEIVKGGAVAKVKGVRAFIPASQLSYTYVDDIGSFLGKVLTVQVIELDREKEKVVVSRKQVERKEVEKKREELFDSIRSGEKLRGTVRKLEKFGAFVDLGGVDGLIHISQMSWKRINDPAEVVAVGDVVDVYVLEVNKERGRLSLALKEVNKNPWNSVDEKYKVSDIVEGTVSKLMNFGAFVELEPGIEGLVHISEITEDRVAKTSDVLKEGDKVKVKVLEINKNDKKMSLSIKEATHDAEEHVEFTDPEAGGNTTIGDLLKDKLKNFKFE
jgi:small subunit ribosomal protein S1